MRVNSGSFQFDFAGPKISYKISVISQPFYSCIGIKMLQYDEKTNLSNSEVAPLLGKDLTSSANQVSTPSS
jgi:hypothetical protein